MTLNQPKKGLDDYGMSRGQRKGKSLGWGETNRGWVFMWEFIVHQSHCPSKPGTPGERKGPPSGVPGLPHGSFQSPNPIRLSNRYGYWKLHVLGSPGPTQLGPRFPRLHPVWFFYLLMQDILFILGWIGAQWKLKWKWNTVKPWQLSWKPALLSPTYRAGLTPVHSCQMGHMVACC